MAYLAKFSALTSSMKRLLRLPYAFAVLSCAGLVVALLALLVDLVMAAGALGLQPAARSGQRRAAPHGLAGSVAASTTTPGAARAVGGSA